MATLWRECLVLSNSTIVLLVFLYIFTKVHVGMDREGHRKKDRWIGGRMDGGKDG